MLPKLSYFSKPNYSCSSHQSNSWKHELPKLELNEVHIFSNLPYLTAEYAISCHENLIKIKCGVKESLPKEMPERTKNDIVSFSMNSRRRLQKKLSSVNLSKYHTPLFVTTTFHNVYPTDSEHLKKFLRNYLKRLKRVNNNLHYVWRLEWQKRKAPHFHIIFFLPSNTSTGQYNNFKSACRSMWARWLDDLTIHSWTYSVHIVPLKAKDKLYQYISKYTAKENFEKSSHYSGQRHGASEHLDLSAKQEVVTSHQFIRHFMNCLWKKISKNFEKFEDFYKVFFSDGEMSFLMSMKDQRILFTEAINSFTPL